jgi:hypothetical protein
MPERHQPLDLPKLSADEANGVEISLRVHEIISEFGSVDELLYELDELEPAEKAKRLNSILFCLYGEAYCDGYVEASVVKRNEEI